MIDITSTFLHQISNACKGLPAGINTTLSIPYKNDKGDKIDYKDKAFLENPVFPVELYEYQRESKIKLSLGKTATSKFAGNNLAANIYKDEAMKAKVTALIDECRQNMNRDLENELRNEIRLLESTDNEKDEANREYTYDLYETIKSFNDYLCIVYLNLANIITYPNETFYQKYVNREIRITSNDALNMANMICKRMQEEFEDIIKENYPIRETVSDIKKMENQLPDQKHVKDMKLSKDIKKKTKRT